VRGGEGGGLRGGGCPAWFAKCRGADPRGKMGDVVFPHGGTREREFFRGAL